jgi:hypothetical protein
MPAFRAADRQSDRQLLQIEIDLGGLAVIEVFRKEADGGVQRGSRSSPARGRQV